jgi:hypothetical protein
LFSQQADESVEAEDIYGSDDDAPDDDLGDEELPDLDPVAGGSRDNTAGKANFECKR